MIVALLALFIALSGSAYAALSILPNSIGTRQLKNGAVTAKKLSPNAASVSAYYNDGKSQPAPQGSSTLTTLSASCPSNDWLFGGGVRLTDSVNQSVVDSYPDAGTDSWVADVVNHGPGSPTFRVFAVCSNI
jgi:hypothetical protein